jgi:hypothetical protein
LRTRTTGRRLLCWVIGSNRSSKAALICSRQNYLSFLAREIKQRRLLVRAFLQRAIAAIN